MTRPSFPRRPGALVAGGYHGASLTTVRIELTVVNLLPVIDLLAVALQRDRRGPHDLAAGTRVVTA